MNENNNMNMPASRGRGRARVTQVEQMQLNSINKLPTQKQINSVDLNNNQEMNK